MQSALSELCGNELEGASVAVRDRFDELFPEEQRRVEAAFPGRRAQFSSGRACARAVLRRLGFPDAPLLSLESRAPAWPRGVVGSLSHSDACCAVAVGPSPPWLAVGLDVEADAPLAPKLEERVCTPAERTWLAQRNPEERSRLAKVVFSVKEAVYKCQHPLAGAPLGFQDVEIQLEPAVGAFRAELRGELPRSAEPLRHPQGRFARVAGLVLSLVALREDGSFSI